MDLDLCRYSNLAESWFEQMVFDIAVNLHDIRLTTFDIRHYANSLRSICV